MHSSRSLEVRDAHAFEHAFAAIAQETPGTCSSYCMDTLTRPHAQQIADFAVREPSANLERGERVYVQAGGPHVLWNEFP